MTAWCAQASGKDNSIPSLQYIYARRSCLCFIFLQPITQNFIVFSMAAAKYTDLGELGINKLFRDYTFTEN